MCGGVHHGEVDGLVKLEMIVRMYSKSVRDNYICVVLGVAYVHMYICAMQSTYSFPWLLD